jgi:multicomponent Na+:H+ antiporter subunit E
MKRAALFVLALLVWLMLILPFGESKAGPQDLLAGVIASLLVVLVMKEVPAENVAKVLDVRRYGWLAVYLLVLAYYVVKANLDVMYRLLHPDMPIRPGIVKVKTDLKTPTGVTALANSITLTPGTLTVNATEDGYLYVHWIYVVSDDPEEAAVHITKRFEWFIKRIVE